jgi:hypothetical protein
MKTKYLALAGLVGIAAVLYFLKFRNRSKMTKQPGTPIRPNAEKHIRDIMKKSKLAV